MKILTRESAIDTIKQIELIKGDDEAAHYMEDELREDFIHTCSLGLYSREETVYIANIVLESNNIEFERWCA